MVCFTTMLMVMLKWYERSPKMLYGCTVRALGGLLLLQTLEMFWVLNSVYKLSFKKNYCVFLKQINVRNYIIIIKVKFSQTTMEFTSKFSSLCQPHLTSKAVTNNY